MSYDKPIHCEVVRMPSALTYRSCLLLIVNIYWFLVQERQAGIILHRQTNQFSGSDKRLRHLWHFDRVSNFSNMWQVYCCVCSVFPSDSLVFTAILVPFNIQILQIPSFFIFTRWNMSGHGEREAENSDMSIIKINDQRWPIWQRTQTETCEVQVPVIQTTLYRHQDLYYSCHIPSIPIPFK